MKALIAALTALSFVAGSVAPADAQIYSQGYEVKQRYVKKKSRSRRAYRGGGEVYYRPRYTQQPQYWADKLPTGSQIWWEQMDREGRGGRGGRN